MTAAFRKLLLKFCIRSIALPWTWSYRYPRFRTWIRFRSWKSCIPSALSAGGSCSGCWILLVLGSDCHHYIKWIKLIEYNHNNPCLPLAELSSLSPALSGCSIALPFPACLDCATSCSSSSPLLSLEDPLDNTSFALDTFFFLTIFLCVCDFLDSFSSFAKSSSRRAWMGFEHNLPTRIM